jgi:hypothetical protein
MTLRSTRIAVVWAVVSMALAVPTAQADPVFLDSGQTSVLLDLTTLESAAGLTLSGVSAKVITPGNLGPNSVAFPINPRNATAPLFPTTFEYDSNDFLSTFSGTIEHEGSVFFNNDTIEVGHFRIGFDGSRVGGDASGFFVESTVGLAAILFDVAAPSVLEALASGLTIQANLLVSPEFASVLQTAGLAASDLTGAMVGSALIQANVIPEPAALTLMGMGVVVGVVATVHRRFARVKA